jgi:predicted transcriptional regulator
MSTSITVELSETVRAALDDAVRAEGVSASEIVDRALKRHLFVRRFRELQAETIEHLRENGMGDLTDEDVFAELDR